MSVAVDTPAPQGVIGDMVEAIKRGAIGLRDEAQRAIDRMRDAYARARMQRMLHLAVLIGLAYLLLRKRRR